MSATHRFSLPGYPASVRALCSDGIERTARPSGNGQPDTFFSIPAYVQVRTMGRYSKRYDVAGYVTPSDDGSGFLFRAYRYRKNWRLLLPSWDIMVCEDCYISHHYGSREVDESEIESARTAGGFPRYLSNPLPLWWIGEGDQVSTSEPLSKLSDHLEVSDNTCSDHWCADGTCDYCGMPEDHGSGIEDFSSSRCEGCASNLAGSRYRLNVTDPS